MDNAVIDLQAMQPEHLEGALTLSRQAGWPHRLEDWQMLLRLSEGLVVMDGQRVVATTFMTPYGVDMATINMVIVDESLRGRGIGRLLMMKALELAGDRTCRLVATEDGLPLYRKLGFVETGEIFQHQGLLAALPAPSADVGWAVGADRSQIEVLDRGAIAADRRDLISYLFAQGRFAVLKDAGVVRGYAAIRDFGRGEVIGPVVAETVAQARSLLAFIMAGRPLGTFLRVDLDGHTDLAPWLVAHGLMPVGGGIAMHRPGSVAAASCAPRIHRFALASQALG
ncbi:Acetyltransferase (GNAT) domain-containing protein [Rhizobium sp. RU35A]|nr:Acetyltransferase (GNAT) domain-containing protein [Rhizobium sp. RU35A]